ncbi:hypothetical protein N8D56_01425 [Devosia sp. A8/3-2]|nr:hypothetical protein N8D56_01425 [Devosia sp. A8/3-2]
MRITKSVSLMLLAGVASIGVVQPSMALEARAFWTGSPWSTNP